MLVISQVGIYSFLGCESVQYRKKKKKKQIFFLSLPSDGCLKTVLCLGTLLGLCVCTYVYHSHVMFYLQQRWVFFFFFLPTLKTQPWTIFLASSENLAVVQICFTSSLIRPAFSETLVSVCEIWQIFEWILTSEIVSPHLPTRHDFTFLTNWFLFKIKKKYPAKIFSDVFID